LLYAAHGSNLHPARLALRLPGVRFIGTAAVTGRNLRFHKRSIDKSGKCDIPAGDGLIHVAIYEMTRDEKAQLDKIEGVGMGYTVETINVAGFGECFTYVAELSYIDNRLRPYSWYKSLVLAGCEALDLPSDYMEGIREISAAEDPDKERNAINLQILNFIRDSVNAAAMIRGQVP